MVHNISIMAHRDAELEGGGDHLIGLLWSISLLSLMESADYVLTKAPHWIVHSRCQVLIIPVW